MTTQLSKIALKSWRRNWPNKKMSERGQKNKYSNYLHISPSNKEECNIAEKCICKHFSYLFSFTMIFKCT